MKKKYIVWIVIIVLILVALASYFIYNKVVEDGKKYEIEEIEEVNYFSFKHENQYGVINKQGNIIIEPIYSNIIIPNPQKAVFICGSNDDTKVFNEKNEEIFTDFENVDAIRLSNIASSFMYEKSVLVYDKDGKKGLIDFDGNQISKPIYDSIETLPYKEGELIVKKDGKSGVINIKGNILVDIEYEEVAVDNYFVDNEGYKYSGYIVSEKTEDGYRYGYIDLNGKLTVKPEYNDLSRVNEIENKDTVYLIAAKNGKYGILKDGNLIVNNDYQSIRYDETDNIFVVEKSKKYGAITLEGKEIIPIQYSQIDITGIYIYAKTSDKTEVYDKQGNLTNMDSNISILETPNENYRIKIDNTQGTSYSIIDKEEKEITKQNYSYLEYFDGDCFIASTSDGKLGIIDVNDTQKLQIKYDSIQRIQNTELITASINSENSMEIYTKDFKLVGTFSDVIIENKDNYIKVYNETDTMYFDTKGNEKKYSEINPEINLYAKKLPNEKWTFEDKVGKTLETSYDKVTDFNQYGFAGIKQDGKWGVINQSGEIIKEPLYETKGRTEPEFLGEYYKVEYGFGEYYYTDDLT